MTHIDQPLISAAPWPRAEWTFVPAGHVPVRYVVIGRRDKEINLTWNRQGPVSEDKLRAEGGQIVYHWTSQSSPGEAPIVVYAVPPAAPVARVN